jgi:hypothetical protein
MIEVSNVNTLNQYPDQIPLYRKWLELRGPEQKHRQTKAQESQGANRMQIPRP